MILVLEPPCAFINANDRLHHHARGKLTKAWRRAAKCAHVWAGPPMDTPVHILAHVRFPTNHRRDVGNLYPTAKALVDGMVDAGLLADDDDTRVIGPDLRRDYPNGPARVRIEIEELP